MNRQILTIAVLALIPASRIAWAKIPAGERERASGALPGYDFRADEVRQIRLPDELDEISGLALDARGRLFGHQDERAIIFELDRESGAIVRTFRAGGNGRRGDWEGITFAGSRLYLIGSDGALLEFDSVGEDGEVPYRSLDAENSDLCDEIEGLEYDPPGNALLIACKRPDKDFKDHLVVLSWSLRTRALDPSPRFDVPLDFLDDYDLDEELSPSGIAIHPATRTILVVAARERLIVELDRQGSVLGVARLRNRHHDQPEGIAVLADGTLIIADEGASGDATLTFYPWRPGRAGR